MDRKMTRAAQRAHARTNTALSVFRSIADELESAAKDHQLVAGQSAKIIEEHQDLVRDHDEAAGKAYAAARKVREIFGSEK